MAAIKNSSSDADVFLMQTFSIPQNRNFLPAHQAPQSPREASGKLFDLVVEGQKALSRAFPPAQAPAPVQQAWSDATWGLDGLQQNLLSTDLDFLNWNSQAGKDLYSLAGSSATDYLKYANALLSELNSAPGQEQLGRYLQNPALSRYALQSFSLGLSSLL